MGFGVVRSSVVNLDGRCRLDRRYDDTPIARLNWHGDRGERGRCLCPNPIDDMDRGGSCALEQLGGFGDATRRVDQDQDCIGRVGGEVDCLGDTGAAELPRNIAPRGINDTRIVTVPTTMNRGQNRAQTIALDNADDGISAVFHSVCYPVFLRGTCDPVSNTDSSTAKWRRQEIGDRRRRDDASASLREVQ